MQYIQNDRTDYSWHNCLYRICDFGIFEESSEEEVEEYYKEFYCENYELDLDGKEKDCVFGVGYEEECILIFVNVEI